ncbi:aminopeptidase N [Tomitella biformata]|uniref:aminopeptidase N n=1 Tax=Tomitella biformata TaxID=630403 RepID=UPI000464964E|nr:aminopeptidase N [Tomitella biformata]
MTSANLTRTETSARAEAITVATYEVGLDLSGSVHTDMIGFPTTTTIELTSNVAETWLDFIGLSVQSVTVNGREIEVAYDGARVAVTGLALDGPNTVVVTATGEYSRSGEGMHRFRDPVDEQVYLYTQYEPSDARRVFACFEQPDMKGRFTFIVTAPTGWEVVSNQIAAQREESDGVQTVEFAQTLPISTYITTVIAGPYRRVANSWSRGDLTVDLGVLCRESLAQYLDADEIFEITKQGLDFFSEHFDYPYPWGKYDQVFVPEYNLGAMENPGAVTFTEAYVFRGAATAAQHQGRANTILHEMAHMWFGDLVTMRWWDDLWLKESFADYMGALASVEATKFTNAWVAFAIQRKAWAYTQDQLQTTHPVVADIVDLEAAKLNFDGITYAKGASALKQLVAHVGQDAFFEGARRYFKAHEFGTATLEDLFTELSATSGRDLEDWATAWLHRSGVSTLTLGRLKKGGRYEIVQTDVRPHTLAIGLYDFDESGDLVLVESVPVEISYARTAIKLRETPLMLLNDGDLTYAKARLGGFSLRTVEQSLDRVVDPLARALIWSMLWNSVRDAELHADRYLAMARKFAPGEPDLALLTTVLANTSFAIEHYCPDAERQERRAEWLETAWTTLFAAEPGSGTQLAWARAMATAAGFDETRAAEIRAILLGEAPGPEGLALDPDLRWALWTALATTGHADQEALDAELARDDTGSGRSAHARALASRPTEEIRAKAWAAAMTNTNLSNDQLDAVIAGFRAGGRRDLIAMLDGDYYAEIRQVWDERSIEIARRIVIGLFPAGRSLESVNHWLEDFGTAPAALQRLMIEQRDHLARDLGVRRFNKR